LLKVVYIYYIPTF